jgi:hypothetical protein
MRSSTACTLHQVLLGWLNQRMMRWAGHVACVGEINANTILVGKPEEKRILRKPRCRWKEDIKMNFRETGLGGCGLNSSGSRKRLVASSCKHGN